MNLSISNIGWEKKQDEMVYEAMQLLGFSGLEIAPTRLFGEFPYEKIQDALKWKNSLRKKEIKVSSIQSIWYGRGEKLFGNQKDRLDLFNYTKKAIDFAAAMECNNIVFGCPRNRCVPEGWTEEQIKDVSVPFFKELGDYAYNNGTILSIEANPVIYHTNYINDTSSAIQLVREVSSKGFAVNFDVGTFIYNGEQIKELADKVKYINHVHISEPGLEMINKRIQHVEIINLLKDENYENYLSIEMKKQSDVVNLISAMRYVKDLIK